MPHSVRRLTSEDGELIATLVDAAVARGDLLGSSSPGGEWVARMVLRYPDQAAVALVDDLPAGFVLPEVKALVVEPACRRRGIGRLLATEAVAIERERGRPEVLMGVRPGDAVAIAFLEATDFAYHSTLWDLELPAAAPARPPSWPPGVSARPFDRGLDVDAWVELFNAAFADHATPLQLDAAAVRAGMDESPSADQDTLLLVDEAGRPVGFCATEPRRIAGGVEPGAEIWTIGVRPDRQGTGLGRQLLRWGVGYLRGLGVETVRLSVNGRNPRALGLYESEGFVRTATRDRWARQVPAQA